ncbi:serine/threonine-protein kinase [Microlunatus parietis]|uniref:non-specific serine/threonine protein kinase n=1 Tax=Microlunatus parietis TaxID=682979 RepID=A0A7Y9IFF0_9ACTN|nr:serine/threonine-protein kinase [Microlunatus parietis]NYE75214.1 serine/threonine-protein kinase PknG [Microlunatus parietis]
MTQGTQATPCSQPGCSGTIVDGYCDVCGSPGGVIGTTTLPSGCTQPGCSGTYVDGYCDVCGAPADTSAAAPATGTPGPATGPAVDDGGGIADPAWTPTTPPVSPPSVPNRGSGDGSGAAGAAGVGSTITRSSSRLDSTALGSKRARGSGSTATRRTHSGSTRLRAARLGAGLTRVPPAPKVDASTVIMRNPEVPENKRSCPSCGAPVGRSRDGRPGRTEGFCAKCRNPFSFTPKLQPGELVANQYEVAGCLAHGGLGWIYLARDKNVSNRWVVLKGLLNSGDKDAQQAAISERQFLAQVQHPLILEIYNFVEHDGAGYSVMEYVGGSSLKDILKQRMRANGGDYDPLPVDQAIAYILEVLPAFQYLHDHGLVYCDFKPDNLIQIGDAIKLIDLGGVRRIDDEESAIYGTVGYQAPEVAEVGTSVASDIYTIGRTLTVLITEFRGYQTAYVNRLPEVQSTPVFQQHDSLYRLLAKACAPDPADRFATVDELRVQLLGVLREVVAAKTEGTALTSAPSMLFETPAITGDRLEWHELPHLRQDTTDPQYPWLANLAVEDPGARLQALELAPGDSAEVRLARARAALQLNDSALVERYTNEMLTEDPWEWRALWISGLSALQQQDFPSAQAAFNAVYGQVPGELAPKLALAAACEEDAYDIAEVLYQVCASTDANYLGPAAFGLARIRVRVRGDVTGAVQALDLIPSTSHGYTEARRQRAELLYQHGSDLSSLAAAADSLRGVRIDRRERSQLTAMILVKALDLVQNGAESTVRIGDIPADPKSLRDGLETAYRDLARSAPDEPTRYRLVDEANRVRRWSLQ